MSDDDFMPGFCSPLREEPTLEEYLERWVGAMCPVPLNEEQKREIVRILQLARREGVSNWFEREMDEERIRAAFPIRRTVTEPRVLQLPHPSEYFVRVHGESVFFYPSRGEALSGENPRRMGYLGSADVRVIADLLADPTKTQEVEE